MKRLIAIAMCLISLVAVLSACNDKGSSSTTPSTDPTSTTAPVITEPTTEPVVAVEPDIVGTWEASMDYAGILNALLGSDPNMGEYFNFSEIIFTQVFQFGEDGTYTVSVDPQSAEDCYSTLVTQLMESLNAYFTANNMELSAVLEEAGMTEEAFVGQMMGKDTFLSSLSEMEDKGEYTLDNDTLTMNGQSYTCQFNSASELTLSTSEDQEALDFVFPMTLIKK